MQNGLRSGKTVSITDSEYRDVASDWVWPVTFNALTEDNQIDQSIYLDLKNGHCKSLKINEESNQLNAAFIFNASTDHWNRPYTGTKRSYICHHEWF